MTRRSEAGSAEPGSSALVRAWAILATLSCLALLVYIGMARREEAERADLAGAVRAARASAVAVTAGPEATNADATVAPIEPGAELPAVPVSLQDVASEWISEDDASRSSGHAILLDLQRRRELIVEHCRHGGYFDSERGEPKGLDWHCERVIAGRIAAIDDGRLTVRDGDGSLAAVGISLTGEGDATRLALSIGGEEITLVPGSKNDLLQRLERRPAVTASKQAALDYESERLAEAHRQEEARRLAEDPLP